MAAYWVVVKTARGEEALSTFKSVSFRARREGFARRRTDTDGSFGSHRYRTKEGPNFSNLLVLHVDLEYYVVPT